MTKRQRPNWRTYSRASRGATAIYRRSLMHGVCIALRGLRHALKIRDNGYWGAAERIARLNAALLRGRTYSGGKIMRQPNRMDRTFNQTVASANLRCDSGAPVSICIVRLRARRARLRNTCRHAVQIRDLELHCFSCMDSLCPALEPAVNLPTAILP
jgi:hypothetical protein